MPAIAAIDVGSNAIRLLIAEVNGGRDFHVLESVREAVRLGQDAFTSGTISEETIEKTTEAFIRFRSLMDKHQVKWSRAVGTSALRESINRDILLDRILHESGIEIEVIGTEEEARLIHQAVSNKIRIQNQMALLIDIGGGSVEITLASNGEILAEESFKIGAVRLLQVLQQKKHGERKFHQMVREYVDAAQRRIKQEIGNRKIDLCIGTGGNIESLGDLRKELLGKEKNSLVTQEELDSLIKKLQGMSYQERVQELRLRPDRADVIIPAAIVLQKIVKLAGVSEVQIPNVGLKEGVLLDMAQELYTGSKPLRREQVISSAKRLGQKYSFDEQHGEKVAALAAKLFDDTKALHRLGLESRLLLEVAAMLHDIGRFINPVGHHKHTFYLLTAAPLLGLNESQRAIVANVARYHRKSFPKIQHESYKLLSTKDRLVVSKLAALLRVADALDTEHGGKVQDFRVEYKKPKFLMHLKGEGDLLLERWALLEKSRLFEEVFSVKFSVEEDE